MVMLSMSSEFQHVFNFIDKDVVGRYYFLWVIAEW